MQTNYARTRIVHICNAQAAARSLALLLSPDVPVLYIYTWRIAVTEIKSFKWYTVGSFPVPGLPTSWASSEFLLKSTQPMARIQKL